MKFFFMLLNIEVLLAISSEEDDKLLEREENKSTVTLFDRPFKWSAALEDIKKGLAGNYITKTQLTKERICLKNLWLIKEKWDLYWVANCAYYRDYCVDCSKGCRKVGLESDSDEWMLSQGIGCAKIYDELNEVLKTYIDAYLELFHGPVKRHVEILKDTNYLEYVEKYIGYLEHLEKYIMHLKRYLEKEQTESDQEGLGTLRSFIKGCADKGFFKGFEKQLKDLEVDLVGLEAKHLNNSILMSFKGYLQRCINYFDEDLCYFKNLLDAKKYFARDKEEHLENYCKHIINSKHCKDITALERVKSQYVKWDMKQKEKRNIEKIKKWIVKQINKQTEMYFLLYHCRIAGSSKENIRKFFLPIKIKKAIEKDISNLEKFFHDIKSRRIELEIIEKELCVQSQGDQELSNTACAAEKEGEELQQKTEDYLNAFKEEMIVLRGIQKQMDGYNPEKMRWADGMTKAPDKKQLLQFDIDTKTWLNRKERVDKLYKCLAEEHKTIVKLISRLKKPAALEKISQLNPKSHKVLRSNPNGYFLYKERAIPDHLGYISSDGLEPLYSSGYTYSSMTAPPDVANTTSSFKTSKATLPVRSNRIFAIISSRLTLPFSSPYRKLDNSSLQELIETSRSESSSDYSSTIFSSDQLSNIPVSSLQQLQTYDQTCSCIEPSKMQTFIPNRNVSLSNPSPEEKTLDLISQSNTKTRPESIVAGPSSIAQGSSYLIHNSLSEDKLQIKEDIGLHSNCLTLKKAYID